MDAMESWVILDPAGQVVLICSGDDAATVVEEWTERGYQAVRLDVQAVTAA